MTSKAFDRVMAEPGSLAARYALLDEWRANSDPRAALMEKQLAYREVSWSERSSGRARHLETEITKLIHASGRAWAGRIAELVDACEFHRGLVGEVTVSGARFLEVAPELFGLAPIQHVNLTAPLGSMTAIAASPWLAKLSSLHVDALGEAVGDLGALALAASPHVARLARLSLWNDAISRTGVDALATSRFLANARYVGLVGNPADPTPFVTDEGDGEYSASRPPLAIELERLHGPLPWLDVPTGHLPSWPQRDELAIVPDYVSDHVLADLEQLARDVDRLETAGDEESVASAGAKRQRLLIELDVSGLLAGTEAVRLRVATYPSLLGYHAACVALLSYLASAARIRLVATAIGSKVTDSVISLDWFRVPAGYTPPGVSVHDWLALCERNFIDPVPTGGGSRFVRLEGKMHQLTFRLEVGPQPRLWRAVAA